MSALYYQDHHHPKREAEGQGVLPLDVDHVDIPLLVEVGMVDDFLLPGEVVQEVIEAGIVAVVQLEEGLDRGMEGVIRIVHDRGVEVPIEIRGEIAEGGDGVQVIVVILVGVPPLFVGEAELGAGVLYLEGKEIGVRVAVLFRLEIAR